MCAGRSLEQGLHYGNNCFSRLSFFWAGAILARGSHRPLASRDLFHLEEDLQPKHCSRKLWISWTQVRLFTVAISAAVSALPGPSCISSPGPSCISGIQKCMHDLCRSKASSRATLHRRQPCKRRHHYCLLWQEPMAAPTLVWVSSSWEVMSSILQVQHIRMLTVPEHAIAVLRIRGSAHSCILQ